MTTDDTDASDAPTPQAHSQRGDVISLLLGALPGVVLAAYITALLFFLNPEIQVTAAGVLRGLLLYSALFGVSTGLLLLVVGGRDPARARRLLPWSLSVVLALAAALSWGHASAYSYYLPPGLNIRLLKAATLLSVSTLVAFLTCLLHTLDRRPYGRRSRTLLAVLSIAVLYIMVERRTAFVPPQPVAPLPSETAYASRPALLVIGLEGATLEAILPLAEQGQLPFFARLLEQGVSASINSQAPVVEPTLWTTLATGRHPYNHRLVGEEVYPAGILRPGESLRLVPPGYTWWGFFSAKSRPVDAADRLHSTLWEILSRLEIPAGAVGWPVSHPPRRPLAFVFSDRYFAGEPRRASTRPGELVDRGAYFRVEAEALDPELVEQLGPPLSFALLQALADDVWRHSLTEFLLDQRSGVDALFLRLEGLAEVSERYYGGFAAVQFDGAQDPERQEAARLVAAYYRYLDRVLAQLDARLSEDRVLAVVSTYGFREPRGWRRLTALTGERALAGSTGGAPDGLLLLHGAGFAPGRRLPEAELVDLLPTLLYSVGLPVARDLDGRVLTGAFESSFLAREPMTFVPSFETLELEPPAPLAPEPLPSADSSAAGE